MTLVKQHTIHPKSASCLRKPMLAYLERDQGRMSMGLARSVGRSLGKEA